MIINRDWLNKLCCIFIIEFYIDSLIFFKEIDLVIWLWKEIYNIMLNILFLFG